MDERIKIGATTMSRLEARAVVESAAKCCENLAADEVVRLVRAAQRANRTLARQRRNSEPGARHAGQGLRGVAS